MYREHSEMMLRIHGISANDWLLLQRLQKEFQELKEAGGQGQKRERRVMVIRV